MTNWIGSSAEVKNAWSYTYTYQYVFMAWYLVKNGEYFTCFTFKTWVQEDARTDAENRIQCWR
jgi:hypothetical protein